MKEIDWSTFPCESCPSYHMADDCTCGKLDEWNEEQNQAVESIKEMEAGWLEKACTFLKLPKEIEEKFKEYMGNDNT